MCRWPWSHRWGAWSKAFIVEVRWIWESDEASPHEIMLYQRRWCDVCNKMQQRKV